MTIEQAMANFITTYGLPILFISIAVIFIIGVLKYFKVFDKIKSANVKKFIYYALDIVLSFGLVAIYFAVDKISFTTYLNYCFKTVTAVTAIYAIYENFGLRKLVRCLGTWFINFVAKKQLETAKQSVSKNETVKKEVIVSHETKSTGTAIQNIGK